MNMIERNHTVSLFGQIAGISEGEALAYLSLVETSIRQLEARIKPGVQPGEELCYACAALAACRYLMLKAPDPALRVGDISADPEGGASRLERAKALKEEFLLACASYLDDPDFVFSQAVPPCG